MWKAGHVEHLLGNGNSALQTSFQTKEIVMKKMFCRQLLACFCLVGVAFTSPAFAAYDGPKFSFRVAHTTPPGNHITLAFEKFKELVEKKSDGRISVQIFPNAMLGSDCVLMEGAQKGSLEMAVSSTPNMANFSPLYRFLTSRISRALKIRKSCTRPLIRENSENTLSRWRMISLSSPSCTPSTATGIL